MKRFEPLLDEPLASCVVVVGDRQLHTRLLAGGREARGAGGARRSGLRSFDRTMPEEINRVLTDQIADLLYTTERGAAEPGARRHRPGAGALLGNLMIDSLHSALPRAVPPARTLAAEGIRRG